MLRWPKEESIGPGISVFELAVNYLGVVGSPMPKVLQYVNKYPAYCHPLQSAEADGNTTDHLGMWFVYLFACNYFPLQICFL